MTSVCVFVSACKAYKCMFGCACVCLVRAFANNTATAAGISGHTSECKLLDLLDFEYAGLYSVNVWIHS